MSSEYLVNLEDLKFKKLVDTQKKAAITGYEINGVDLNSIYEPYDGDNYGNATADVTNYQSKGADLNTFFLNASSVLNPVINSIKFSTITYVTASTRKVGVLVNASYTDNDLRLEINGGNTTYFIPNNKVTEIPLNNESRFIVVTAFNDYTSVNKSITFLFQKVTRNNNITESLSNAYAFDLRMYGSGGSGGSGGNRRSDPPGNGSQGGSGGRIIGVISRPGTFTGSYSIRVGAGGSGALGQNNDYEDGNNGNDGSITSLTFDNDTCICSGGKGGKGGSRANNEVSTLPRSDENGFYGAKGSSTSSEFVGFLSGSDKSDGNDGVLSNGANRDQRNSPNQFNSTDYSYGSGGGGKARGGGSGPTENGGNGYLSVIIYSILYQ